MHITHSGRRAFSTSCFSYCHHGSRTRPSTCLPILPVFVHRSTPLKLPNASSLSSSSSPPQITSIFSAQLDVLQQHPSNFCRFHRHRCLHSPAGFGKAFRRSFSEARQSPEPAHKVLGLETMNPTKSQLRNAYFVKAKACHPDVNQFNPGAKEEFSRISRAYQQLLGEILEKEASGEQIKETIGDYFTCPTLGHHKRFSLPGDSTFFSLQNVLYHSLPSLSGNMKCQIENCPFCAMFGEAGGGNYYEAALDPSVSKPRDWAKSKKTSIKGKKLPPVQPLFRK